MAAILSAEHVTKAYTLKKLLTDVTLYIGEHDRIGVVGINGTGKSTLLKILAGIEEPDSGTVMRKNGLRVSFLPQRPDYRVERTAVEQVLFDAPKDVGAPDEYEAKTLLSQFGISDFEADVRTLSGGQKKRVALAAALIRPVDLLLLDEPTNHIDAPTIALLEEKLGKYRGALMMVTHDRYFLDRVCNRIAEISGGELYLHDGNFSYYLEQKAARHEPVPRFREEVRTLMDERFHVTLLSLPMLTLVLFTALPIAFMILIAFTDTATAVFGAYFKLQTFIFMPIFGISSGLIPILSYNYGSGALRRVSASVRFGQQFTAVLSLSGALLLSLLASPLLRSAFRASPEALAMGAPALRIIALSFFFAGTSIIFCSAFQSLGRSRWSLLVALLRQILLLLPAAALLLALKPALVWAAFPLSELISCFAAALLYRRTIQKQLL